MHLSSEKKLKVKTKDHGNVTIITIEDSGEGIPIEKIERIFDPFYTTKPSVRKNKDEPTGTGLGLPYCKRVIELHQGRILVDSQRGSGTTIKIIFAS